MPDIAIAVAISLPANQSVTIFAIATFRRMPPAAREKSAGHLQRPRRRQSHHQFADDHERKADERKADERKALVAQSRADRASGKSQDDARGMIEPDQQSDICDTECEVCNEQRGERPDDLKLQADPHSNGKQQGENTPAI